MSLSDVACKNAKPDKKEYKLSDGGGLNLHVMPSGSKLWRMKYRYMKKEKTLSIGPYPEIGLAQARKERDLARGMLANNQDPSIAKQEKKRLMAISASNTFEAIARRWHEKNAPTWSSKHSATILHRLECDVFPEIGKVPIADIGTPRIAALIETVEDRGAAEMARRCLQYCRAVFAYAKIHGLVQHNPADIKASDILSATGRRHHPAMEAKDLPVFLRKLYSNEARLYKPTQIAMEMMMYTFVRTGELIKARWEEFDFEKRVWEIPANRMKMKRPHLVPLSNQVITLLEDLKKFSGNRPYLFPGQRDPKGHMSNNALLVALKRMGYNGIHTGHGFRALALSTIMEELGYPYEIPDVQLAHAKKGDVEAAYICVNQNGDRVHGFDVNTLTVMANESYEAFVEGLQKEIEKEEGIKFGIVEQHTFANLVIQGVDGKDEYLGAAKSEELHKHLLSSQYIDQRGKIQDKLKKDLKEGKVELPLAFVPQTVQINAVLKKIAGGLNIQNNDNKRTIKLNKAVFESLEFKELWDKVKFKTTYNVEFDPAALIQKCSEELKKNIIVGKTKFTYITAKVGVERSGLTTKEDKNTPHTYDAKDYQIPDILSYLQNETNLKRQTILEILLRSERLDDFKNNPQKFLDQAKSLIRSTMQGFIVDGIKYQKIGDQAFYAQELFESEELIGYLNKNMLEAVKSVYDHVIYDSETVEAELAQAFEKNEQVKVYAKLPSWFKVDTPLGSYNPDWAVLFDIDGQERLYFVVESKETHIEALLRKEAQGKIKCGRAHFEALGADTNYVVASNMDKLMDQVSSH